jgi:serine protease Do
MLKIRSLFFASIFASTLVGGLAVKAETLPIATPQSPAPFAAQPANRYWNLRQTPITDVVRKVRGAVVNIQSEKPASSDDFSMVGSAKSNINGMGTGIIIDSRGYIITNNHVVEDVSILRVRLSDNTQLPAQVIARDPEHDLALLKIDAKKTLPVITLGTASDLMVGETVVAIGNAYGYEHTVTVGVVSATRRDVSLNKEISYKGLIQTDASINPGNSGGPLVNIHGELIGVNVAIRAGAQGIGFAIPVDTMVRVSGELMGSKRGNVKHGVGLRNEVKLEQTDGIRRAAMVDAVEGGSPGSRAGINKGDELLAIEDFQVKSSLDVERALVDKSPGDKVVFHFRRDGSEQKVEVTLEPGKPVIAVAEVVWRRIGLKVQPISSDAVAKANNQLHGGLLINEIRPESVAARAGVQKGDIWVGLHQCDLISIVNISFVLNHPDLTTFQPVRFFIVRAGQVHRGFLPHID